MIKAEVNGKRTDIETSWEELTWGKYLKLLDGDMTQGFALSVFLDMPHEVIQKANIKGLEKVLKGLSFLHETPKIDPKPNKIGEFILPKDITLQSVGQFEFMKMKIAEASKKPTIREQTEMLALYAAIYCQPLNGDEFDGEKAQWLAEKFKEAPCLEVMSAGSFFMTNCLSLQSGLPMSYLRKNIAMKRSKLDLSGFLRRSGFTRFWTILLVMWERMTKR